MSILMQSLTLAMIYYMSDYVVSGTIGHALIALHLYPAFNWCAHCQFSYPKKIGVSRAQQLMMSIGWDLA